MKIQYEKWPDSGSEEISIEGAIRNGIAEDYETRGIAESAMERTDNMAGVLGRLCETLQEKGLLDAKEILDIANFYHSDCRFISD